MPTTDEEGIRRTLALQAQLRDDGGVDDWPTNFVPDGVFESPAGRFEGRAAIAKHLNHLYDSGGKIGRHFVGPSVIDVDGDRARSKTDFTFIAPAGDGTFRLLASGRYYDELVHDTDGRWRFVTRRVELVAGHVDAAEPASDKVTHVAAREAANQVWHRPLAHVIPGALSSATAQTSGMTRLEAISGRTVGSENLWMGETHVAPATSSGDHHHGEAETAIYVVSGQPRFVFLEDGKEVVIETNPGDYIFVPPYTPHREENPSQDSTAVVVIARTTQEGIVVNLPSLWGTDEAPA